MKRKLTASPEEAIDGNLKKISISSTDRTKYDPMSFLKGKEENFERRIKEKAQDKILHDNASEIDKK
jgi:hypothetical protein